MAGDDAAPGSWPARTRELIGEPVFTPPEVAAAAGVELEWLRRLWRALGFPPVPDGERVFTAADAERARAARTLVDQRTIEPEVLIQLTRTMGQALARIADAHVAGIADRIERLMPDATADRDEVLWGVTHALLATFDPFLSYVWRRHLLAAAWRQTAAAADAARASGSLVIGFADLVGFTATSQQLDERELAAMVDRFEARVYEHVPERGGRVIKMIGDEVMFAAEDPAAAAEIALSLVEAHHADEALPDLRVGLALGPTLAWQGDLFGPTVNLASRIVNVARPASVLIAPELAAALEGGAGLVVRALRPIHLHGIGRVRLHLLRRAEAPA